MASLLNHLNPNPPPPAPTVISTKHTAVPDRDNTTSNKPQPTFETLPPELHLLIASYLIYPDALSLKHTSRHFYHLVDTGVKLKIDWLVQRRRLHLECPNNQRCDLGSDLRFCRGSVRCVYRKCDSGWKLTES